MAATNSSSQYQALRSPDQARQLVLEVLRDHADSLLGVARRHSLCLDDAQDAYQRALEIFLRHAHRLDADRVSKWVHTVVKHEAMRLRATRQRQVPSEDVDLDAHQAPHLPDAHERVLAFDRVTRTAEALQRLKPQELRALSLQAQGLSYQEIAEHCQWTYTKVNRCITEGRRSFLARYADIEAGEECARWAATLSALVDGEASADDLSALRPHLRNCGACRATVRELHASRRSIAAVLPLPIAAAALGDGAHVVTRGFGRAWELLTSHLHERAVVTATKLQVAADAASAGKVAAVAASAAALAGGGVAANRVVNSANHTASAVATTQRPAAAMRPGSVSASSRPSRQSAAAKEFSLAGPSATREFELDGGATVSTEAREFGRGGHAAAPATSGKAGGGAAQAGAAQAAAEFGP